MHLSRRSFFLGAGALVAAPSIVRASSLMPVKVPTFVPEPWLVCDGRAVLKSQYPELFRVVRHMLYDDMSTFFRLPDMRGRLIVPDTQRPSGRRRVEYVISTSDQGTMPAGMAIVRYTP